MFAMLKLWSCALIMALGQGSTTPPSAATPTRAITIALAEDDDEPTPAPVTFTARFTVDDLMPLLTKRLDLLPLPLQLDGQREHCIAALQRVSMDALVDDLLPFLTQRFGEQFDPAQDVLVMPVPPAQRVTIDAPELPGGKYAGPDREVVGFQLHDIDEPTYINTVIRVLYAARQLLETGDPHVDRSAANYYQLAAEREIAALRDARNRQQADAASRQAVRERIGRQLGVIDAQGHLDLDKAQWVKESRRFSYVVREGKFIEKLKPLVERINRDLETAGFNADSLTDRPGIHFDKDLGDVEILLPRVLLETFLAEADLLERRMAEDSMISIEVVRLTDRDIVTGAVASRLDAGFRGIHDVEGFNQDAVIRQAGINALTAVANRELQIVNLSGIQAGTLPAGTSPVTLPALELPPIQRDRTSTTLGSSMSIGADDAFFDGQEQSYGFSYIGPDGIEHRLAFDVVDNLREFWDRIERNLIVHKIRKTETLEQFTVPVGPATKTFEGIAALISQENQQIVVATGTGAISELSATAGTWLVIKDFEITPIPGSSTALSESEMRAIEDRVLLTMLLRDPLVGVEVKTGLVEADHREELQSLLEAFRTEYRDRPLRDGNRAVSFGSLYDVRRKETVQDASLEKKERNSKITLTFYSSQGTILDKTGVTALGDANDLTSFTTQLSPNVVTPISSFFTKGASGTKDTSQITGVARGENENKEKTMTHLVVRARFPTDDRERKDRDEGRFLGYFELPLSREPLSTVNLPFLSSSEHPLERLAQVRVGRMFPALDASRIQQASVWFNPNSLAGDVPREVWEACQTRLLMNVKILSESAPQIQAVTADYRQRFIVEVRSLLEYDSDFFDAPNIALRNMGHWNDPNRIVLALRNSAGRFALRRLIIMIDELGALLVPTDYVDNYLAVSGPGVWGKHRIAPLDDGQVTALRRDVANHYLRIEEVYGDAFLEAVSLLCGLGTYQSVDVDRVTSGPFRGYADLVVFDNSTELHADIAATRRAHEDFLLLRSGGFKGGLFEPSLTVLEDLDESARVYTVRGKAILDHEFSALSSYTQD